MDDLYIADRYIAKARSAADRGVEFTLSFTSFKNLMRAKRCYYTGVEFVSGKDSKIHRTIDRKDHSLGYVKGNVVACTKAANVLKSLIENPELGMTIGQAYDVVSKFKRDVGVK